MSPNQAFLKDFLRDAPAADLTAMKTASILRRDGSQITGFVVTHPQHGTVGIIDKSAVRWLDKGGWWWLMHESDGWNPKEVYVKKDSPMLTCPFCNEPDFDAPGLKYHLSNHCEKFQQTKSS